MTIETLNEKIKYFIRKRQNTPPTDTATHESINTMLTKLYQVKENYYKTLRTWKRQGGNPFDLCKQIKKLKNA